MCLPPPRPCVLPSMLIVPSIASADKLPTPASEFDTSAPSRRLPDTLFLFDAFNRKAIGKKHSSELASLRAQPDGYVCQAYRNIQQPAACLPRRLPQARRRMPVCRRIVVVQARNQLRQMQAYGVDTTAFEKLTQECAIIACVAHAQGTYDQLRRQLGKLTSWKHCSKPAPAKPCACMNSLKKATSSATKPPQRNTPKAIPLCRK